MQLKSDKLTRKETFQMKSIKLIKKIKANENQKIKEKLQFHIAKSPRQAFTLKLEFKCVCFD